MCKNILIYRSSSFDLHNWGCTSINRQLPYALNSLSFIYTSAFRKLGGGGYEVKSAWKCVNNRTLESVLESYYTPPSLLAF